MPTSESEIQKIAALAQIKVDSHAAKQLSHDVSAIINFVEQLRAINTEDMNPLLHPLDLNQRFRTDEITEQNNVTELAKISPLFNNNLYLVPKVIDVEN